MGFTATLETFLADITGRTPCGLLFAASFGLYRFIEGIDRASRGGGR
jgi:hypothetical protein